MSGFSKWSVWVTSALTAATGAAYFVTKYLLASPAPYSVVNHPWEPYFLKAHILVSPLLLFALGLVAVEHIWKHYVTGVRLSRRTAIVTAAAVVPMVATGYLIQVFTDEGWARAMAISHIAFGTLYAVGLLLHSWIVRRANGHVARDGRSGPPGRRRSPGPAGVREGRPRRSRAPRPGAAAPPSEVSGPRHEG